MHKTNAAGVALMGAAVVSVYWVSDLWMLFASLVAFAAGSLLNKSERSLRHLESESLPLGLFALAFALIVASVGETHLNQLSGGMLGVIKKWVDVQDAVQMILSGQLEVGMTGYAEKKIAVLHGMAPASTLIPAVLVLVVAMTAFLRMWPFASVNEGESSSEGSERIVQIFRISLAYSVLLRLFVEVLHRPKAFLYEPFGWSGPMMAVLLLNVAFALLTLIRGGRAEDDKSSQSLRHLIVCLLGISAVVLASYTAHLTRAKVGLFLPEEVEWVEQQVQQGHQAMLALAASAILMEIYALYVWLRKPNRAAKKIYWWCLAALPPSPTFFAGWLLVDGMLEHSEVRWLGYGLMGIWGVVVAMVMTRIFGNKKD